MGKSNTGYNCRDLTVPIYSSKIFVSVFYLKTFASTVFLDKTVKFVKKNRKNREKITIAKNLYENKGLNGKTNELFS